MTPQSKIITFARVVLAIVVVSVGIWWSLAPSGPGAGFISGNGRIEATETDLATTLKMLQGHTGQKDDPYVARTTGAGISNDLQTENCCTLVPLGHPGIARSPAVNASWIAAASSAWPRRSSV